ncbi:MAG TPA: hypothetical protein VG860_22085 [Terriglobia bacterium]|jgi:hypothetical protein|nr:hypothetical protein [Terriglobia bacterium]
MKQKPGQPCARSTSGQPPLRYLPGLLSFAGVLGLFLLTGSTRLYAWGPGAHRLVNNWAVSTLPPAVRPFFEANRAFLVDHASDPDDWIKKDLYEASRHYIYLDKYGLFPYIELPYSYKMAVEKYGGRRLSHNGILPWRIGDYSLRLTNDFKAQKWDDVKLDAAALASYVADAHDPLSTTQNFDGQLTEQQGLSVRWGTSLTDRYTNFFMFRAGEAGKVDDPTAYGFTMVLEANTWVDRILWADWNARAGLSDYTDEYFDRFYTQIGSTAVQEMNAAAHDAGSYWYTAWLNAGQPALPSH